MFNQTVDNKDCKTSTEQEQSPVTVQNYFTGEYSRLRDGSLVLYIGGTHLKLGIFRGRLDGPYVSVEFDKGKQSTIKAKDIMSVKLQQIKEVEAVIGNSLEIELPTRVLTKVNN